MKSDLKETLVALGVIVISNVFMYLVALWTGVIRAEVNLDYFIPIVLLLLRSKILYVLGFFIVFSFDFLNIFGQIFPFIRIVDLFYLLKFSFLSSTIYQIYAFSLFLAFFIQVILIYKLFKKENFKYHLLVFNICLFVYGYSVYFMESSVGKLWKPSANFIVNSQLLNYINYRNHGFIENYKQNGEALDQVKIQGATSELFLNPFEEKKILLVINEAWGVTHNPDVQQAVLRPLLQQSQVQNVKLSQITFDGFTIGGELRELCQKVPLHFNLKNQLQGFEKCLPQLYKQAGYETIAVHGALGLMYDRQDWYPRAGFKTMMFRDQGLNLPNSICYSFPGNCDRDIGPKVAEQFARHDKLFLYWLTLNTHAVYDERDLVDDQFDCAVFGIPHTSDSCRNLKLQTQFFATLAKMVQSGQLSGAKVIVVGDHQPVLTKKNSTVFDEKVVPVLSFKVK